MQKDMLKELTLFDSIFRNSRVDKTTRETLVKATTVVATSTSTSNPSSTTSMPGSAITVPSTGMLALDCPSLTGTTQVINLGTARWSFAATCGVDYNGNGVDVMAVISYSFRGCLQACASYNKNSAKDDCVAVVFNSDLASVPLYFGNCFLKKFKTIARNNTGPAAYIGVVLTPTG
jgi:hypothetical protein